MDKPAIQNTHLVKRSILFYIIVFFGGVFEEAVTSKEPANPDYTLSKSRRQQFG